MTSSLVVQTSFIGDVILTTPLIAKLAEVGDVDVITTPVGATVLANHPAIRRVMVYDKHGGDRGVVGFVRAVTGAHRLGGEGSPHEPRDRRAYLAQGSVRSAFLAAAAGWRERVGFDTSAGRALYTRRVAYRNDWHHARRLLSLADGTYAERADLAVLRPRVYPGDRDVAEVDVLLRELRRPLVALAPGSVWETKRWPYYGELGRRVSEDFDVVVIGGEGDAAAAAAIVRCVAPGRIVDAIGKLSLLGSAELLRRAVVLVTNDSAPQHLASAVGTPTVTVFGPTVAAFGFGPLAPWSRVVGREGLACRPCDRHGPRRCPLGHWKCMRDLSVDEVYGVVTEMTQRGVTR